LVVAALLLAITGNGLVGIDFQDIRDCLHAAGPIRAWLWQGLGRQTIADAARDLAQAAAEAEDSPGRSCGGDSHDDRAAIMDPARHGRTHRKPGAAGGCGLCPGGFHR
jgi:hypothetical protein